jgi:hypothetical protein
MKSVVAIVPMRMTFVGRPWPSIAPMSMGGRPIAGAISMSA